MRKLIEERPVVWSTKPPFPHNMLMEITNACNHRCAFCGYDQMRRNHGMADQSLMFRILEEAYRLGTREVGFYMIGEPLLNPKLEEYIQKAADLGYTYIYLTSNGVLATPEMLKRMGKAGLNSIKFSINAASAETYARIHGKNDFETVRQNIEAASELREKGEIDYSLFISFIECEWNKNETKLFHEIFEDKVDKIYVFECINMGGNYRAEELLRKGLVQSVKCGVTVPCEMVFNRLHVTCEGYLDACCVDMNNTMAIADLRKMGLKEAWESEIYQNLRQQHLNRKFEKNACYNCTHCSFEDFVPLNKDLFV